MQRRLQPFAGADFALIAQAVPVVPSSAFHQQLHRLFYMLLVRIALGDDQRPAHYAR